MFEDFLEFNKVLWMYLKNKLIMVTHDIHAMARRGESPMLFDQFERLNRKKENHSILTEHRFILCTYILEK